MHIGQGFDSPGSAFGDIHVGLAFGNMLLGLRFGNLQLELGLGHLQFGFEYGKLYWVSAIYYLGKHLALHDSVWNFDPIS